MLLLPILSLRLRRHRSHLPAIAYFFKRSRVIDPTDDSGIAGPPGWQKVRCSSQGELVKEFEGALLVCSSSRFKIIS